MLHSSLLVASALLLRSSALLVPDIVDDVNVGPDLVEAQTAHHLQVDVKCRECPFPLIVEDSIVWDDKFDSSLAFNFTTSESSLALNDRQVYPVPASPVFLEAVLHRLSDGLESIPVPLGFALEFLPGKRSVDEESELLSFHFTVIDIAGFPVPVDTVHVQLIKTPSGDLLIAKANVDVSPDSDTSWRQCRRNPKCLKDLIWARILSVVAAAKARVLQAIAKISKGCPGRRPQGNGQKPGSDDQHHHHHSFKHALSRAIRLIAIPAALGLVSGVTACVLGMIVGRGIAALWLFFRRHGRIRESSSLEQGDRTERQALMTDGEDELPPQYEAEWNGEIALPAEKE